MRIARFVHPPGGASALIANIGSAQMKRLDFGCVLYPGTYRVLVLLLALEVNDLPGDRDDPVRQ